MNRLTLLALLIFPTTSLAQSEASQAPAAIPTAGTEIVATGDSWIRVFPDHVLVDIVLDESGSSATEAEKLLEKRREKLASAAKSVADDAAVFVRTTELSSAAGRGGALAAQTPVRAIRYIGVESAHPERAAQLVDALLANGASSLLTVTYTVRDREAQIRKGAVDATLQAKRQAEAIAQTLGVALGPLVATAVAADDEASLMIREKQEGVPPADFRDQEIKITASVRYEIAAAAKR